MHVFVHKVDLSQLKKLHLLQLDILKDPTWMFRHMTFILSSIPRSLRIVKIICDWTLLQESWDHDDLIRDCHKFEDALLKIEPGKPHIIFNVYPFMAKNRYLFTYELLARRFSYLHKSGRLHVRNESPDSDHFDGMYDLFL